MAHEHGTMPAALCWGISVFLACWVRQRPGLQNVSGLLHCHAAMSASLLFYLLLLDGVIWVQSYPWVVIAKDETKSTISYTPSNQ
jgi:hypothetical protein